MKFASWKENLCIFFHFPNHVEDEINGNMRIPSWQIVLEMHLTTTKFTTSKFSLLQILLRQMSFLILSWNETYCSIWSIFSLFFSFRQQFSILLLAKLSTFQLKFISFFLFQWSFFDAIVKVWSSKTSRVETFSIENCTTCFFKGSEWFEERESSIKMKRTFLVWILR